MQRFLKRDKNFYLLILLLTLLGVSACQKSGDNDISVNDAAYIDLNSLETELHRYYMRIEDTLRYVHNISEQKEIDDMMQILIDEGDVDAPFILEKENGLPKLKYVDYLEFKVYFHQMKPDTISTYTLPLDLPNDQ